MNTEATSVVFQVPMRNVDIIRSNFRFIHLKQLCMFPFLAHRIVHVRVRYQAY